MSRTTSTPPNKAPFPPCCPRTHASSTKHCNTPKKKKRQKAATPLYILSTIYSLLKRRMLLTRRLRLSARSKLMLPRLKPGCATVKPGVLVRMNLPPTERTPREILKCSILALRDNGGGTRSGGGGAGNGSTKVVCISLPLCWCGSQLVPEVSRSLAPISMPVCIRQTQNTRPRTTAPCWVGARCGKVKLSRYSSGKDKNTFVHETMPS